MLWHATARRGSPTKFPTTCRGKSSATRPTASTTATLTTRHGKDRGKRQDPRHATVMFTARHGNTHGKPRDHVHGNTTCDKPRDRCRGRCLGEYHGKHHWGQVARCMHLVGGSRASNWMGVLRGQCTKWEQGARWGFAANLATDLPWVLPRISPWVLQRTLPPRVLSSVLLSVLLLPCATWPVPICAEVPKKSCSRLA